MSFEVFDKRHLEFDALVAYMQDAGLTVTDPIATERVLSIVGYHRLGGYRYPLRQLLRVDEQVPEWHQWRADTYFPGASFDDVLALSNFDDDLRVLLTEGLMDFEVSLRNAIGHVLGRRTLLDYMDPSFLDAVRCAETVVRNGEIHNKIENWSRTVEDAVRDAKKSENDAVSHHTRKYGDPVPIWTLLEVLSFGKLPFMELMKQEDLREIGRMFGQKQERRLIAWAFAFVDLRNLAAHGARVWNRSMKRPLKAVQASVDDRLIHIVKGQIDSTHAQPSKLYFVSAALAYSLQSMDERSDWPRRFVDLVDRFPSLNVDIDPWRSMGFPEGWRSERLWSI